MSLKGKIILLVITVLAGAGIIVETALMMYGWGIVLKIICYGVAAACVIVGAVSFALNKTPLIKTCFLASICAIVIISLIALISHFARLNDYPTDGEKIDRLTEIIRSTGSWGMVVYFFIQILQVLILPLPALVCYIPGTQIWGPLYATLLASAGVITGSLICYAIGKFFGMRAAEWIAGKEAVEKYAKILGNKGKVIFLLMQILPFFPDDILCIIAGLTAMNFAFFLVTIMVVRPAIIALYCYLGTGNIIPFSGWGIPVWIAIILVCVVLAILSIKYQDKFESWLVSKFRKKDKEELEKVPNEGVQPEIEVENTEQPTLDKPPPEENQSEQKTDSES